MRVVVTVAKVERAGADLGLSVELRLAADLPADPPRRAFLVLVPVAVQAAELRALLLDRVRREVLAYQEEQARAADVAAKVAALAGQSWVVEV